MCIRDRTLATFEFRVEHRAGTKHGNADALSRAPHLPEIEADATRELGDRRVNSLPGEIPIGGDAQEGDPILREVRGWLRRGEKPGAVTLKGADPELQHSLGLLDGVLVKEGPATAGLRRRRQLCVPERLRDEVVRWAHELGGHQAARKTAARVLQRYYFPGAMAAAEEWTESCLTCQKKKGAQPDQRHTYAPIRAGYPFDEVALDFVGPLPPAPSGEVYLLTARDTFSGWLEAYPLRQATAKAVVDTLQQELYPRFGYPERLRTDNGTPFVSDLFREAARTLSLIHI